MEKKNYQCGVCGVYCGQCPNVNGRVKMIAGELKRLVDTVRYGWLELPEVKPGFKFTEFRKGLEWFASRARATSSTHSKASHETLL